jgi:hypothetical protein
MRESDEGMEESYSLEAVSLDIHIETRLWISQEGDTCMIY